MGTEGESAVAQRGGGGVKKTDSQLIASEGGSDIYYMTYGEIG